MDGNVAAEGEGRWVDGGPRGRVRCITAQPALAAGVRDVLATWLPGVEVVSEWPVAMPPAGDDEAPPAAPGASATECLVAGPEPSGRAALQLLRELRASGYAKGVVLLASTEAPGEGRDWQAGGAEAREAAQLGATLHLTESLTGEALAAAVAEAMTDGSGAGAADGAADAVDEGGAAGERLREELQRTRQKLAAGALALRLQHSLNNPLAALLAEAQLLELEELAPEHRDAVRRIIELCRRVVVEVRELGGGAVRPRWK